MEGPARQPGSARLTRTQPYQLVGHVGKQYPRKMYYVAYVVLASKDNRAELWAATGTPAKALGDVRDYLPSGWLLTLTGEMLSITEAAALDIPPGGVRRLSDASHKDRREAAALQPGR
jgi:hypothetical protein